MFKVGDKVVRKDQIYGRWLDCPTAVVTGLTANGDLKFDNEGVVWYSKYFDLYVEPVVVPTPSVAVPLPKFKVGDRVQTTNGQYGALVEEVITVTEFRYKITGTKDSTRESKLSPSVLPRQIMVDGVYYKEIL